MSESIEDTSIRYVRSADGVHIAYWAHGSGPAFVQTPSFPVSNLEIEWRSRRYRSWWEKLAFDRMLVRYDCRGSGLSDRHPSDYSLKAQVADLEAVVDKLRLATFALMGFNHSGPPAIAYAVAHPERVSHLILWYTYAKASDYNTNRVLAGRMLIDTDWDLYTELEGHRATRGLADSGVGERYAAFLRRSVEPAGLTAAFSAMESIDVISLLAKVRVPTLVLHRQESRVLDAGVARGLASAIPNARLVLLDGGAIAPFIGNGDRVTEEIRGFLAEPTVTTFPDGLSPREADVLRQIAVGRSNRQIAEEFRISERTVARHITNLYHKIGVHNKAEATAYALHHNLGSR